jgi:hypothetical protein
VSGLHRRLVAGRGVGRPKKGLGVAAPKTEDIAVGGKPTMDTATLGARANMVESDRGGQNEPLLLAGHRERGLQDISPAASGDTVTTTVGGDEAWRQQVAAAQHWPQPPPPPPHCEAHEPAAEHKESTPCRVPCCPESLPGRALAALFRMLMDTDPWCPLVCLPLQRHHVAQPSSVSFKVLLALAAALMPALQLFALWCPGAEQGDISICFPFRYGEVREWGAGDFAMAGGLFLLILFPVLWWQFVHVVHTQGCVYKLRHSLEEFGVPVSSGWLVPALRFVLLVVRMVLGIIATVWLGSVALCPDDSGCWPSRREWFWVVPVTVVQLLCALVFVPVAGTWLVALVLCVNFATSSVQHLIVHRIPRVKQMGNDDDLESVDNAVWKAEIIRPTTALVEVQLPLLSHFGEAIGCVTATCFTAAVVTLPELIVRLGSSDPDSKVFDIFWRILVLLFIPMIALVFPVVVSDAAGKELVTAVHHMRPQGPGFADDRVSALKAYILGVNNDQRPGFVVWGYVISKTFLGTVATAVAGIYPLVVYLVDEYS